MNSIPVSGYYTFISHSLPKPSGCENLRYQQQQHKAKEQQNQHRKVENITNSSKSRHVTKQNDDTTMLMTINKARTND